MITLCTPAVAGATESATGTDCLCFSVTELVLPSENVPSLPTSDRL